MQDAVQQLAVGFALVAVVRVDAEWLWTALLWIAVVLAVLSGAQYLWHATQAPTTRAPAGAGQVA